MSGRPDLYSPRRQLLIRISIAATAVAVLSSLVIFLGRDGKESPATTRTTVRTTAPPTTGTTTPPTEIQLAADELSLFVEKHRGLKFKNRVLVTLLDAEQFKARFREVTASGGNSGAETTLKALGLMSEGASLEEEFSEATVSIVIGFYDPRTDELAVRGGSATPLVRKTLVHELTHALQDQHFDLNRKLDDKTNEAASGFQSVREGDAVRIEEIYLTTLSPGEREAINNEQAPIAQTPIPEGITPQALQLLSLPYTAGLSFMSSIWERGGQPLADKTFQNPPITMEQVIDPDKYLAGEGIMQVPNLPERAGIVDQGVLGQAGISLFLGLHLDSSTGDQAAAGWGGDKYQSFVDGSSHCMMAHIVMESAQDTAELVNALQRWSSASGKSSVSQQESLVIFSACS